MVMFTAKLLLNENFSILFSFDVLKKTKGYSDRCEIWKIVMLLGLLSLKTVIQLLLI